MFKPSRHNNLSIFIISQDYYELPRRTIRSNRTIYHICQPKNYRDVQSLRQDKASKDMTPRKYKLSNSTCWKERYQLLTFDMTKGNYTGRYRLGIDSLFVPDTHPF